MLARGSASNVFMLFYIPENHSSWKYTEAKVIWASINWVLIFQLSNLGSPLKEQLPNVVFHLNRFHRQPCRSS